MLAPFFIRQITSPLPVMPACPEPGQRTPDCEAIFYRENGIKAFTSVPKVRLLKAEHGLGLCHKDNQTGKENALAGRSVNKSF
ncbi:hypothetical protein NL54_12745 [Pantoea stewartii]|nr:hypothetical protein NL54_12745 [Pantoea stewartii]KHN60378.1 hypothetical protein OI73_18690 [Pantoea stewartii]